MATTVGVNSAGDIRTDYMRLLVTQLQNQNPMEPMDNNQMASQLAQLSQLEQLENMGSTFADVLTSQKASLATNWIGKAVTFFPEGATEAVTGKVEAVDVASGAARLRVGNYSVELDEIESVGM